MVMIPETPYTIRIRTRGNGVGAGHRQGPSGSRPGGFRTAAGLLVAALVISACGGGGGGGSGVVAGGSSGGAGGGRSPAIDSYQWGLGTVRAYQAYARLAGKEGSSVKPGSQAAVVGMIDTGIDKGHYLLAGKTITEQFLDTAADETGQQGFSHGTAVASLIVGERLPGGRAHGVAWGARLAVFAIPLGSGGGPYTPLPPANLASRDSGDAAIYRTVLDWRTGGEPIDFLNLSFGYSGLISEYTATDLTTYYPTTIDVLKQADRATHNLDKTILVWAAGNAHGRRCTATGAAWCVNGRVVASSPEILSGLMARIADVRDHSIAVAALGRDGRIADFSNRCGIAANWCITAPGEQMRVAYFGPDPDDAHKPANQRRVVRGFSRNASGTSYAAPMVTGGLAVMKHFFRDQLSNTALVTRLFATANDRGRYSNSSIYGHGVMDLDAATAPVGTNRLALGGRVDGPGSPVPETHINLGGTLGDGLVRAFAGREIAAFDDLGAPFWFDLGDFASEPDRLSMTERLRDLMAPVPGPHPLGARAFPFSHRPKGTDPGAAPAGAYRLDFGILATPAGAEGGLLGLAERAATLSLAAGDGLAFTAFSSLGIDGVDPAVGSTVRWRPAGAKLGLRAGWLAERDAMLGTSAHGAFGRLTAHAAFAGVERETEIAGWRVAGGAEIGVVDPSRHGGLFTDVTSLATSAFALRATRPLDGDTSLRLSISQPLRVESGRATLSIPVGRTKGGDVLRDTVTADLSPTGRQLDVEARWQRRTRSGGDLRLGAGWTLQPGHRADADASLSLLAGYRRAF